MLFTIYPYFFKKTWVFDNKKLNLDKEAFVQGADVIIEYISHYIEGAKDGFALTFSSERMINSHYSLTFIKSEMGGSWYQLDGTDLQGWLCPALFKFFPTAPERIYVSVAQDCLISRWMNKLTKIFSKKNPLVMQS